MYNTALPFDIRAIIVASIFVTMLLGLGNVVIWLTTTTFPGFGDGRWGML